MLNRMVLTCISAIAVALAGLPAQATRNPPIQAKKYSIDLVQSVAPCTAPTTTAPGILSTPACDPIVPTNPTCTFGPKGRGKVTMKVIADGDIATSANLSGLAPSCTGETLCLIVSMRNSYNNCASTGDCSALNQIDFPLFGPCCTVTANGRCSAKMTANVFFAGILAPANATEFTIGEVGMRQSGGAGVAFRGGLLLP